MYLSKLLLAIFLAGVIGTGTELLLLGHFEDVWQFVPLVLLGLGILITPWYALRPSVRALRAFHALLILFAASGVLGLYLHYRGNAEFEREADPAIRGLQLFIASITGATPALSPGAMVLLALIGYAITVAGPRSVAGGR